MSVPAAPSAVRPEAPRTRKPVARTLAVVEADPFGGGLVRLTIRGEQSLYRTREIPCDPEFGPFGFQYQKLAPDHSTIGTPYSLSVSSRDPAEAVITCDCPGHTFHGFCRHADSLRVLMARRK